MKNVLVMAMLLLGTSVSFANSDFDKCIEELGEDMASMKECAYRDFQVEEKKMHAAYDKLIDLFKTLGKDEEQNGFAFYKELYQRLIDAQLAWVFFRDAECELHAESIGGSLEGLEVTGCMTRMTEQRTEVLVKLYEKNK